MGLTLYYERNTCAFAPHIALEEAGADYRAERIVFAEGRQRSEAYLAINPKGRVPALVTPRGVLTETPALLAYIAQAYPQARSRRSTIRSPSPTRSLSWATSRPPCMSPTRTGRARRAGRTSRPRMRT